MPELDGEAEGTHRAQEGLTILGLLWLSELSKHSIDQRVMPFFGPKAGKWEEDMKAIKEQKDRSSGPKF